MSTKIEILAARVADHPSFTPPPGMAMLEGGQTPDWEDPGTAGWLLGMVVDTAEADNMGTVQVTFPSDVDAPGAVLTIEEADIDPEEEALDEDEDEGDLLIYEGDTLGEACLWAIADFLGIE